MTTARNNIAVTGDQKVQPYLMLDAWRGFAALWVVMVHSCAPVIGTGGDSPWLAHEALYAFSAWGQLGVSLFFVISGYCIASAAVTALRRPSPILYFFRSRVRRIYPPYFVATMMCVLASVAVNFLVRHGKTPAPHHHSLSFFGQSISFYLATLTLTQPLFHAPLVLIVVWSLCYEVAFYVIVAALIGCLYKLVGSASKLLSGMHLVTVFSLIWLIVSPSTCPFPLDLWPEFGFGAIAYMLISRPDEKRAKVFFLLLLTLAALQAILHPGPHDLVHPSSRIKMVTCILFTLIILVLHRFDKDLIKKPFVHVLAWLGTFSYSLYLSHTIILPFVEQAGKRLGFQGTTYWISFMLQVAISVAFARFFYIFFEKPFMSKPAPKTERQAEVAAIVSPAP